MTPDDLELFVEQDDFRDWQSSLIYEKGKFGEEGSDTAIEARQLAVANQAKLEAAVNQSAQDLCAYMLSSFSKFDSKEAKERARSFVPDLPARLTAAEMNALPTHAEAEIEESLTGQGLTPAIAAEPRFWALCHAFWIEAGMFGSNLPVVFLDGQGRNDSEARTRNFLRRTAGLHGVRGNTSVLTDCLLSAAWWRVCVSKEAASVATGEGLDFSTENAHEALLPRAVWTGIVDNAVKRATVVNAPRARTAIVVAIHQYRAVSNKHPTGGRIKSAVQRVAQLGHSHNLHLVEWKRLLEEAHEGLASDTSSDSESD